MSVNSTHCEQKSGSDPLTYPLSNSVKTFILPLKFPRFFQRFLLSLRAEIGGNIWHNFCSIECIVENPYEQKNLSILAEKSRGIVAEKNPFKRVKNHL